LSTTIPGFAAYNFIPREKTPGVSPGMRALRDGAKLNPAVVASRRDENKGTTGVSPWGSMKNN